MTADKFDYILPKPIVNAKEGNSLDELTKRYEKLLEPSMVVKTGKKVSNVIPDKIKEIGKSTKDTITEQELYIQAMKVIAEGFKAVEEQAARFAVSEKTIIKKVNAIVPDNEINSLDQVCLARSYDLSKIVNQYKTQDFWTAFIEGGVTGAFGFWGLPFNIVLSTFLFYRAVQSIAMYYGYDVKNSSSELVIASEVFMNSLSPASSDLNEMSGIIGKVMLISKATAVGQGVKKGWTEMASRGGIELLLTQMRALANKAAQKALENVGAKSLEKSIFKDIFEQLGKKLTQKAIARSIPVVSGVIGALFDSAQMKEVLEYADVFYNKRYLLEKEVRILALTSVVPEIIDVEMTEIN